MKIIYRISDTGYNKVKPAYINNYNCLKNALQVFPEQEFDWLIIADNISRTTYDMVYTLYKGIIICTSVGNGAGTFNLALDKALLGTEDIVYFLENDYLHLGDSPRIIKEGIELGAEYVSLYDHPDKYINGANPFVSDGGEETKVFLSKSCHWKFTNSTTMTFATTIKTLREDEAILREYTTGSYPRDFEMFLSLRKIGRSLVTPLPGYATHGEVAWLSPLVNWESVC